VTKETHPDEQVQSPLEVERGSLEILLVTVIRAVAGVLRLAIGRRARQEQLDLEPADEQGGGSEYVRMIP
jgi:hypothetical protein